MTQLRSLAPLVRTVNTDAIKPPKPPTKIKDPIYNTPEFRHWRAQVVARAGGRCQAMDQHGLRCPKSQPQHRMYADHIMELRDGGALLDPGNGMCMCASHHEIKTAQAREARGAWSGSLTRPILPMPTCRVKLVCGPPAAGKSTYVKANAAPGDIIIDIDYIARQHGLGRQRPDDATRTLLMDRNQRLAALAKQPADRTAWVILTAPSSKLRIWWCNMLGVLPDDMIVLMPTRDELYRRVRADPDRDDVRYHHMNLIDQWFDRENGYVGGVA